MAVMRLALAQLRSHLYDKKTNLYRIAQTVAEAAGKQEADYVLFPELYLTGYTLNENVTDLAEPIEGESVNYMREIASQHSTGMIVGLPEKEDDHIYNTAIVIDKNGDIIGKYRKTHLFDFEKQWFSPGDSCPVFDTPFGRIAVMITYDMEFPETSRIFAQKGARLILVLAANMVPYQTYQSVFLRARAMENHVFVALANKVGLENDHIFFGESEVIHPTGKTIYQSYNNELISTVDIDFAQTNTAKGLLDYINNRRVDLYRSEGLVNGVIKEQI
ncbi:carbon-nitrogen hydrolase family protein [Siminovitchia sp. FSL H7-0308]|uniref:Amidohydrolase n=1 Tax=Siminovitchia thermophila TaxID=1245522 RepID=A0ABS2R761_9BACI|nr:carbon-nitrogen hydrolase family protein [Siminovitchia thermophila]MBM7715495.1 putative amidohydrolase [Siminovitchia thermophila]ONK21415.1 carbon-nitrogen hydrolase family protein [Bacillus sp. VT-16-64]